ncbi:hypothetical protein [Methylomagnum sp.]
MTKKLRNFEQVKDVLDYGIELHRELKSLYETLADQSQQARAKLLIGLSGATRAKPRRDLEAV